MCFVNHLPDILHIVAFQINKYSHFTVTSTYLLSTPNRLTAWHVYLPIDRQPILLSVKLPSYLFCSSLVSNFQLMIDCGILSTVQSMVALSFSFTTLLLEILEMVGWSTKNDNFCITSARASWSSKINVISSNAFRLSKLYVQEANKYIIYPHICILILWL